MELIKEFELGMNTNDKFYFIDSNILLAMCQFYYKGKCDKGDQVTEELKRFILKARNYGIQNQFSITEVCYDYTRNTINTEQMNKIMIAYDNLIMNMSANEVMRHKGAPAPEAMRNLPRNHKLKNVFECKLSRYLFEDNNEMTEIFYEIYLYFLKIHSLYFQKISAIQKVEELFDFMINKIGNFLAYEFYMAVLLFLGKHEEREIATGIFKPSKELTLDHVLNSVLDIVQYRMAYFVADFSVVMKKPRTPIFATMDTYLQKYIEHNISYRTITTKNIITPFIHFSEDIRDEYVKQWNEFYSNRFYPCIRLRYIQAHMKKMDDDERKKILDRVYQNILEYEKELYI